MLLHGRRTCSLAPSAHCPHTLGDLLVGVRPVRRQPGGRRPVQVPSTHQLFLGPQLPQPHPLRQQGPPVVSPHGLVNQATAEVRRPDTHQALLLEEPAVVRQLPLDLAKHPHDDQQLLCLHTGLQLVTDRPALLAARRRLGGMVTYQANPDMMVRPSTTSMKMMTAMKPILLVIPVALMARPRKLIQLLLILAAVAVKAHLLCVHRVHRVLEDGRRL